MYVTRSHKRKQTKIFTIYIYILGYTEACDITLQNVKEPNKLLHQLLGELGRRRKVK